MDTSAFIDDPRIIQHIQDYLSEVPNYTPAEIYDKIETYGYIGQKQAKKAMSLFAYRHVNRLRKIYFEYIDEATLPSKDNFLLIGPTGCGKTFLIEILFKHILKLPTVIIDITSYSETGYVGQDPVSILTRLIYAAEKDQYLASIGVVCIDEFDKLSSGKNNAVFSGAGTTKDVSGIGVQRELLKMLEGADVDVPMHLSQASYAERITFNTNNVAFVACGAFSGFKSIVNAQQKGNIGFGHANNQANSNNNEGIAVSYQRSDLEKVAHFEAYGMMPELIGRFSRIIPFEALSEKDLKTIVQKSTMQQYAKEFELEGVTLKVEEEVLDHIVQDAIKRETGARALKYALLEYLEDACFELYSSKEPISMVRLYKENDIIQWGLQ